MHRCRGWARVALGLALCGLVAGCRGATLADPAAIADAQTAARVKTVLVNDPALGIRPIEVSVSNGVARLAGRVATQAELNRAVALARGVTGVTDVRVALVVGADPSLEPEAPVPPPVPEVGDFEPQSPPRLLAFGLSVGGSLPQSGQLEPRLTVGPLIKIGGGRGLGLAIGFNWFKAGYTSIGDGGSSLARVSVKPVMLGLGYTFGRERVSFAPSLVAGYAFNGLTVSEHGSTAGALAVDVDNSIVWRPGASLWVDATPRVAINLSGGYLMTGLDLTVFQDGRLSRRSLKGDTLQLHAGVAYRIF